MKPEPLAITNLFHGQPSLNSSPSSSPVSIHVPACPWNDGCLRWINMVEICLFSWKIICQNWLNNLQERRKYWHMQKKGANFHHLQTRLLPMKSNRTRCKILANHRPYINIVNNDYSSTLSLSKEFVLHFSMGFRFYRATAFSSQAIHFSIC